MTQQIETTVSPIWIQPMMIPAVAIPSPEALGGTERVSFLASCPAQIATILARKGNKVKPRIPAIKLTIANVLLGSKVILLF